MRRIDMGWAFGVAASAALAAGCGGTTTEGGPGTTGGTGGGGGYGGGPAAPVAQADFANQLAQTMCPNVASCCTRNGFTADQAACTTAAVAAAQTELLSPPNPSAVQYDPAAAGACINQVSSHYQQCSSREGTSDACNHIWIGLRPVGAACQKSIECAAQSGQRAYCTNGQCSLSNPGDSGQGAPGVEGDPCSSTCTTTANDSVCSSSIGSSGGTPPSTAPKSCETTSGLYCDSTTSVCTRVPALGAPCNGYCATGGYCENGVCTPQHATGPCPSSDACSSGSYCRYSSTPSECIPKKPTGSPCQGSEECLTGFCLSGACAADTPVDAQICAGIFK